LFKGDETLAISWFRTWASSTAETPVSGSKLDSTNPNPKNVFKKQSAKATVKKPEAMAKETVKKPEAMAKVAVKKPMATVKATVKKPVTKSEAAALHSAGRSKKKDRNMPSLCRGKQGNKK
jgi:hypothetical protein